MIISVEFLTTQSSFNLAISVPNTLMQVTRGMLCFRTLDMLYFRTFHNLFKHLTYTK